MTKLTFHTEGVQALKFCNDEHHLISVGVASERSIVMWEVNSGTCLSTLSTDAIVNSIVIDQTCDLQTLCFYSLGN